MKKWIASFLKILIKIYQYTFGLILPPSCRFYPSCSQYMREALEVRGFWVGLGYGIVRLLKCHPWHPGGYDPVAR